MGGKQSVAAAVPGRCAHWVIRNSDLKKATTFLSEVFGMRVIRHEENAEPCGITCNGRYNNAWSKTMIGYDTEDKAYCLEVTYNYGVMDYPVGTGLLDFTIGVPDTAAALAKAKELGYEVQGSTIVGPDQYRYTVAAPGKSQEKFLHVSLRVADLAASLEFYTKSLGMADLTGSHPKPAVPGGAKYAVVGYTQGGSLVPLVLVQDGTKPVVEQFEGRHAVSMPEAELRKVYADLETNHKDLIVHPLQELNEVLGILCIFIMKDLDGFELCIVSSETFDKAVLQAADWKGPDWDQRRTFIDARAPKKMKGLSS